MALTKQQELALFEILQVPYTPTVYKLQPDDNLVADTVNASTTEYQAYSLIQSRLTVIAADSELETVLVLSLIHI